MKDDERQAPIAEHLQRQFGLDDDQIEAMVPALLAALAEHVAALERAVSAADPGAIGGAAHTLKGALLNLGLADGARLAAAIERAGKQGLQDFDYRAAFVSLRNALATFVD